MATVDLAVQDLHTFGNIRCIVASWTPLTSANVDGAPLEMPGCADRSFQVAGTFAGATVVCQGSNDGSNWATLTDPQGNAISFTSAGLEQVMEITRHLRPFLSGGAGGTSISVTVVAKRVV